MSAGFFRTYSPQGDGNYSQKATLALGIPAIVFQNLFPARGRKRCSLHLFLCSYQRFSEPIPRKGTETLAIQPTVANQEKEKFFRTYSPQGDGNGSELQAVINRFNSFRFSEPIPRKGTETTKGFYSVFPSKVLFFRTYSPQGDGN